jgi:hypothetical protein
MGVVSAQPGRYQRSASGMAGALLVTLLVIGGYVAFRAFNRTNLDEKPAHVDYLAQVRDAQQAGSRVVYPARLPAGWYATRVTLSPGSPSELELSMLTGDGQYVGFVDSPEPVSELIGTYVDSDARSGARVTVAGTVAGSVASRWDTWTDTGGDTALVARVGSGATQESLLVFGTVSQARLEQLAASLTSSRVSG